MTGFDIAVLIMVGIAALAGLTRGFVQEFLTLLAWVFAVAAIHNLLPQLTDALHDYVHSDSGASVLAFAILLLVPYAVIKLLAARLGEASRSSVIGPIDRILGFGFGAVKGTVVVVLGFSVLALGYDVTWGRDGRPQWITQARSYPFINAASEKLVDALAKRRAEATDDSAAAADDGSDTPAAKPVRKHHRPAGE
jgi:membrane protein required for colicin V production